MRRSWWPGVWAREIKRGRHLWARLQFYLSVGLRFDVLTAKYLSNITVKYNISLGISLGTDGY
jgi:hypothetical protein